MAGKSYTQTARTNEVSLAIETFFIAPYGASYSAAARVDVDSPPSGFYSMGTVVEDSPTIRVSREKYQLELGIPKIVAYETVMSVGAEISFSIYSNSFWQAQFALGNTDITTIATVGTATAETQYIGKCNITYYHLLGVADFYNGSQVVHEFPRVSPANEWEEAFRPDAANGMPLSFTAQGYKTTIDSCSQLIVGMRHYFGPDPDCSCE